MRRIIEDIKVLKANSKTLKEFAKDKYIGEDGVARIHIYVDSIDMFNPLTDPNDPDLSSEIFNYIENEAYFIPADYPIRVIVHSSKDVDCALIEKKIKEHYWKRLADKNDDLKKNSVASIILFSIGLLFLSVFFVLQSIPKTKDLFNEIFSIIGSFAVWESVDFFLINRSKLRIEYLNIAQLALLSLEIEKEETK